MIYANITLKVGANVELEQNGDALLSLSMKKVKRTGK